MDSAENLPDGPASLEGIAAELYGLAPGDFVAARDAAAKRAKSAGQRELAGQIHRLAKPTTVAWLANQLVRAHRDEIEPLLKLGADLREATASLKGDDLRALSAQQRRVISALVQQARRLAVSAGQQVTEATARGLEETLRAALADGDLAAELTHGQLSGPLEHVGFQAPPEGAAAGSAPRQKITQSPSNDGPAVEDAGSHKERAAEKRAAERARAEQELAEAHAGAKDAATAEEEAASRLAEVTQSLANLNDEVRRLEKELKQATHQRAEADRAENEARSVHAKAARAADRARTRMDVAERALSRET